MQESYTYLIIFLDSINPKVLKKKSVWVEIWKKN